MKLKVVLLTVVALLITSFAAARPALATHLWDITGVTCDDASHTITIYGHVGSGSSVYTNVYVNGNFLNGFGSSGLGNISYTVSNASFKDGAHILVSNSDTGTSASTTCGTPVLFNDGRLDKFYAGQTAAVYCANGGFKFYALYKGVGYVAFTMTKAQLANYPAQANNYLIKQVKGVRLYRLSSGQLQVVRDMGDGTDYHFIFNDADCAA